MLNVIIIDDEIKSTDLISGYLKEYCPNIKIIGIANNAKSGINEILTKKPDLILLDIGLPDMDGFQMLRCLPLIDFDIVFITAFDHLAIEAFKVCAVDYLLKPVNIKDFIQAINKVEEKQNSSKKTTNNYLDLLNNIKTQKCRKIAIPTKEKNCYIKVDDIIRVEAYVNYCKIYLADNGSMLISKSLKEFETYLNDDNFFRTHKTHLVNLDYVKNLRFVDGTAVEMEDNTVIPVARRKKDAFQNKMDEYINKFH